MASPQPRIPRLDPVGPDHRAGGAYATPGVVYA